MRKGLFLARTGESFLLLFLYCAITVLSLWPWPRYFTTGFPDHFDPPFHAWKLQVEADKLLRKHELLPDPGTNIYYPYANELYFDALLWPQGMVAAGLKAIGCGPILVYNLVLLFFWGLSGLFLYLVLRELALSRPAAFFGGLAMCLIPYRISYYVEFNMQMCFGLPLFFYFWLRFVRKPDFSSATGLAVAFWLQAVSELYQAVILALIFPLLVAPSLFAFVRRHGRSARTYGYAFLSLSLAAGLCLLYLHPYFTLFHGGYGRGIREMLNHSLEPLAYLGPLLVKFFCQVDFSGTVKADEMSVFPSFTLLLLWGGALLTGSFFGPGRERDAAPLLALRWLRLVSVVLFFVLLLLLCHQEPSHRTRVLLLIIGNASLILALLCTFVLGIFTSHDRERQFLAGLATAALFSFILSLGPALRVLDQSHQAPNLLFSFVNSFFPLDGFRVMSRFSIVVMLYLVISASVYLDSLFSKRRLPAHLFVAVLLAILVLEARQLPHAYARFPLVLSPHIQKVLQVGERSALVVVPMGDRYLDARYMLKIGGTRNLLVNGFGGFTPTLQMKISRALGKRPARAFNLIESIWPRPIMVVDKKNLSPLVDRGYKTDEAYIRARSHLVAADSRFAVYQPREEIQPRDEYRRFVRADLLRRNPEYRFQAKKLGPGSGIEYLFVLFNGLVVDRVTLGNEWRQYRISLPVSGISGGDYEMVFLRGLRDNTWTARAGTFAPATGKPDLSPERLAVYTSQITSTGYPGWLYSVPGLPAGEQSLALDLDKGIILAGIGMSRDALRPGEDCILRSYWSIPVRRGKPPLQVRFTFQDDRGHVFDVASPLLRRQPLSFLLSRPVNKLFLEQIRIHVPDNVPAGRYRILVSVQKIGSGLVKKSNATGSGKKTDTSLIVQVKR